MSSDGDCDSKASTNPPGKEPDTTEDNVQNANLVEDILDLHVATSDIFESPKGIDTHFVMHSNNE